MTAPRVRSRRDWIGVYVRGAAMGVAELVPGVSGGTIAFVTGIFDELVRTLAGLTPGSLRVFVESGLVRGVREYWQRQNLGFLLVLGLGMLTSIALLARLLSTLLVTARPLVWAFFLGLILVSVVQLGHRREARWLWRLGPVGVVAGLALTFAEPHAVAPSTWMFFVGGAIAVSAWLLPAVSGSFLLLVLGLYEHVLTALTTLDWIPLTTFIAGCAVGLLAFANLLSWLIERHREPVLALLTGFMAGAAVQLWPWQLDGVVTSPAVYQASSGADAYQGGALLAFAGGALAIVYLARLAR